MALAILLVVALFFVRSCTVAVPEDPTDQEVELGVPEEIPGPMEARMECTELDPIQLRCQWEDDHGVIHQSGKPSEHTVGRIRLQKSSGGEVILRSRCGGPHQLITVTCNSWPPMAVSDLGENDTCYFARSWPIEYERRGVGCDLLSGSRS